MHHLLVGILAFIIVLACVAYNDGFFANLPGWFSPIWDFATSEPHLTAFRHLILHIVFWDICINVNNHRKRFLHRLVVLARVYHSYEKSILYYGHSG